eukprot:scaffold95666_cov33-Tisochrysis_lutea.AAC.1
MAACWNLAHGSHPGEPDAPLARVACASWNSAHGSQPGEPGEHVHVGPQVQLIHGQRPALRCRSRSAHSPVHTHTPAPSRAREREEPGKSIGIEGARGWGQGQVFFPAFSSLPPLSPLPSLRPLPLLFANATDSARTAQGGMGRKPTKRRDMRYERYKYKPIHARR